MSFTEERTMKWSLTMLLAAVLAALSTGSAQAEDKNKAVVLLDGLLNPSGLAAQPGTKHLFISDSGAERILLYHIDGQGDHVYDKVITKFGKDVYGKGPKYDIGPLGLAFLGKQLVVGGGEKLDSEEVLHIYDVPPHGQTLTADKGTVLGPIPAGPESGKGEGNFFGVATTADAIYVTSNGDDTKGWILKSEVKAGKPGPLKPFIATKSKVDVDAPAAITIDKAGNLVVGQMGEVGTAGDSLLTVYNTKGDLVTSAKTGLSDLVGLAYSPKSGKLYGIDFSWAKESDGGLFSITVEGTGKDAKVKTEKLTSLDKPAAMAFGPDGKLYVVQFGSKKGDDDKKRPGTLVVIEGDL